MLTIGICDDHIEHVKQIEKYLVEEMKENDYEIIKETNPDNFMEMLNQQGLPWQLNELAGPVAF